MKKIHVFFLVLKIAILIQFILIIANKQSVDSKIYLITEILFKSSLSIFIEYFLFKHELDDVIFEDKVVLSLAGGLLMYDAIFNDLPKLLKQYNVNLNIPFF